MDRCLPSKIAIAFLLGLTVLSAVAAQVVQPNTREYDLTIERQPLGAALQELSERTGVQHGYLPFDLNEEKLEVGPIVGRYTIAAALTKMLTPMGFGFEWVNARTINIVPPRMMPPKTPRLNRKRKGAIVNPSAFKDSPPNTLEGVVVRGSRMWSLGVDTPSLLVLDSERLAEFGVSTIPEALQYVPQLPYGRRQNFFPTGEQYAELRGLGADTTLVLINGRRAQITASSFHNLGLTAFDLNTLPLTAVERIEVLLDTPTVAAGADAIGGIINIDLKNDISRPSVDFRYGTAAGGSREQRVSVTTGATLSDFVRAAATIDYFDRTPLLGSERDRWRNQDFRRFGGIDWRFPVSTRANIRSAAPGNLPGLPSSTAVVPLGSTGLDLSPADFLATSGQENLESLGRFHSIIPRTEQLSFVGSADLVLGPRVAGFAELLYADRTTDVQLAPASFEVLVPANNPFNPFDAPVYAGIMVGKPQHTVTNSRWLRGSIGLRGTVGDWQWDLLGSRTEDEGRVSWHYPLDSYSRILNALDQSDPALAANVFRDGLEGLEFLIDPPVRNGHSVKGSQAQLTLRGDLIALPSGTVTAFTGAEWRRDTASFAEVLPVLTSMPVPVHTNASRDVTSMFVEVRASLGDSVQLTSGARADHYEHVGTSRNGQYGLTWRALKNVTVVGSYGTTFRAPSLFELFQVRTPMPAMLVDLRGGTGVGVRTMIIGGNSKLKPATARTWSAGASWAPESVAGLQLSARYWQTAVKDQVIRIRWPLLLAHEDIFADRVHRAPPTAQESAAGLPGRLERLDLSWTNAGRLHASGVDVSASYTAETKIGKWIASLASTWTDEFTTALHPALDREDQVGIANLLGTIPRWRAIGSLTWRGRTTNVSTAVRFVPPYRDKGDDPCFCNSEPIGDKRRSRVIPSQFIVDTQVVFDIGAWTNRRTAWTDLRLTVGATNLFDAAPPFAEAGGFAGYDATQGDLRGRFGYLRLSKQF